MAGLKIQAVRTSRFLYVVCKYNWLTKEGPSIISQVQPPALLGFSTWPSETGARGGHDHSESEALLASELQQTLT